MAVVDLSSIGTGATSGIAEIFQELGVTFGVALGKDGLLSLFADPAKIPWF